MNPAHTQRRKPRCNILAISSRNTTNEHHEFDLDRFGHNTWAMCTKLNSASELRTQIRGAGGAVVRLADAMPRVEVLGSSANTLRATRHRALSERVGCW